MNDLVTESIQTEEPKDKSRIAAAGSVIGAVLASSCCVLPLVLVTLGFLGFGFWHVYRKPKVACEDGTFCATPTSSRVTESALWIATVLIVLALTIDFWAPLFY